MIQSFVKCFHPYFNSIKVQLEQENPREICVKLDYFNSIKVQLEPQLEATINKLVKEFQFHKGTIRTTQYRVELSAPLIFQFHKGTIRTRLFYFSSATCTIISIP